MVLNFLYIYNKKQKIQEKLCKSGKSKFIAIREVEFLSRPLSSFLWILTKAIRKKAKRPLTYVTLCKGLFFPKSRVSNKYGGTGLYHGPVRPHRENDDWK